MKPLAIALFAFLVPCARSQGLGCAIPPHYSAPGYLPIVGSDGSGGDHVQFAYSATTNAGGTTLDNAVSPFILFPSKGTTPATLQVALNPAVVAQYQPGLLYTLNILFTSALGGNRIFYLAARDVNEANNTDWQAMGTWHVM